MSIQEIKEDRIDLTKYITHFTHKAGNYSSFDILKKIIDDGFIKFTWAVRNEKRTIFGKKPAVCFTEQPLYALIDYVRKRKAKDKVDLYGVALLKDEMYNKFNARPVIYGTTSNKIEEKDEFGNYYIENFPEEELYRYMLTSIDKTNDWTHEREWRWNDPKSQSKLDGLPIWAISDYDNDCGGDQTFSYSEIIIIVKTKKESDELIELFRGKKDENIHNIHNIKKTYIYIVQNGNTKDKNIRLDDDLRESSLVSIRDELKKLRK